MWGAAGKPAFWLRLLWLPMRRGFGTINYLKILSVRPALCKPHAAALLFPLIC